MTSRPLSLPGTPVTGVPRPAVPRPAVPSPVRALSVLAAAVLALTACSTSDAPGASPTGRSASSAPSGAGSTAPATPAGPADPDAAGTVDPAAVLQVEDQVSQGPTVNVKAAAVTRGGWVVVASEGGRNVLGAGLVPPGTTPTTIQVSLAEVITRPTELTARLYDDANPDGLYGAGDRPVGNGRRDGDDDPAVFAGELEVFTFQGADVVNK